MINGVNHKLIFFLFFVCSGICRAQEQVNLWNQIRTELYREKITVSSIARERIKNYVLNSSDPRIIRGLRLLLQPELDAAENELVSMCSNMKIDGYSDDWPKGKMFQDASNDLLTVDPNGPISVYNPSNDLKRFQCEIGGANIYCMVEPYRMPQPGESFHFRINIMVPICRTIYAMVWTDWGFLVQTWNPEDGSFVSQYTPPDASSAMANVFEARVPLVHFPNLPERFIMQPVIWNEQLNAWDYLWSSATYSKMKERFHNYSLELFGKYAEKVDLIPNDVRPVVQALVDSFPYRMVADNIKNEVVDDGLGMMTQFNLASRYLFPGQQPLSELSLEELLVWANRHALITAFDVLWRHRNSLTAASGNYDGKTYRFLFLKPKTLYTARNFINRENLMVADSLPETVFNIESRVMSNWKYRTTLDHAEKLKDINGYWYSVYRANLYEVQKGHTVITNVGPDVIEKRWNWGLNFQMKYIYDNDFIYGNCGDSTVLSLVMAKALGVPAIHYHYDIFNDHYRQAIHSFPAYYSSQTSHYQPFMPGYSQIFDWTLPPDNSDVKVFFFAELPIVGSYWTYGTRRISSIKDYISTNLCAFVSPIDSWNTIANYGLTRNTLIKCGLGK